MLDQFETPYYHIGYDESLWCAQSIGEGSHSASRRLQVAGSRAAEWVKEILGWTLFEAGSNLLQRHPPFTHPRFPWLNARSAQFVRETAGHTNFGPNQTLSYTAEEWEISYQADDDRLVRWWGDEQRPAGVTGEGWRYCSRKVELAVTVQTLGTGVLFFNKLQNGANPVVPDGATGQLIPSRTRWLTWYQIPVTLGAGGLPELPGRLQETIDETVGCMNSDEFDGASPQTLLMLDPKFSYKRMADGEPCADITYVFSQRGGPDLTAVALDTDTDTADFTRIIRATGKYGRVYRKDDDTKVRSIYAAKPFARLLKFD